MNHYLLPASISIALVISGCPIVPTQAQSTDSIIKGTVNYPSDMLPAQKVCAENQQSKQLFCTETKQSQENFSIPVPAGSYVVFSTPCKETYRQNVICRDGYISRLRGYYTAYAKCGATVQCARKHKKNPRLVIRIIAGKTIANIKPHDWYTKN
jgi:hypothetical protein